MPIMRCPSCGKPNPDFLDVCQYCETPLHPAEGAAPAAPKPAADETLISSSAATIRCQSCGRTNPAHLDVCQYCQARLKPLLAGNPPASPAAAETPAPAVNLMDRLRSMGANPPAAEPEPEPEEPVEPSPANWMSRLRGMADDSPAPTGLEAEPKADEPDWMWTGGQPETPAADTPAAPPPTEVTPGSDALPDWLRDPNAPALPEAGSPSAGKPRRKMTDWLNARPGAAPVEPPAENDVPDWLKNLAGTSSGASTLPVSGPLPPDSPAARAASNPPPSGTSDLPDWLKNIRTSTPLGGSEEPPGPQASSAHRMQALPEWMRTGTIAGPEPLPDPDLEPPDEAAPEPPPLSAAPVDSAPEAEAPASPEAAPAEAGSEDLPAWLRAIITPGAADETIPVPAKPKKKKMTDWLGNQPPPPTEAANADAELPDWLKALSAGESAPPASTPTSPVAEGLPDWLKPGDAFEADAAPAEAEAAPTQTELGQVAPEATPPATPAPAADDSLPDWLRGIQTGSAPVPVDAEATLVPPSRPMPGAATLTPTTPPAAPELPTPATTAADLPDWLTSLAPTTGLASGESPADLDNDTLAWLNTLGGEPGATAAPAEPAAPAMAAPVSATPTPETLDLGSVTLPAEAPAWLDELAAASHAPAAPAAPVSAAPEIQPTPEAEMPEWLKTMRGLPGANDPPPEEMPDWLRTMRGLAPLAQEERQARAAETAAFQQEQAGAQPPLGAAPSDAEATLVSRGPALPPGASATEAGALPGWLAAMRPVDIAQATAGEADTYEERLGVLAGMRGVLRAEPAVAQPQRSAPAVNRLAVSDTHSAHVKLLTELQQSEAAAAPRKGSAASVARYIERWVIFAVLAAAIILAQFQLPGLFGAPTSWPRAADDAYNAVIAAGAQSGAAGTLARPALIAFDYEVAQQGELNPAAVAIIRQLMGEGVPVVGVSTRVTGAAVGNALLNAAAAQLTADTQFSYTYGTHYLNLGYIPGGPIGLLQFASVPHSSFLGDFTDQYNVDNDVWNAPAVSQVDTLEKFSLIVLISGSPEATRAWVEQAQLNAPNVPMIAVVSASAEPLVRPYLESDPPQLDGLVVGLGGGAALEQQLGRPGAALATWPALGGGLLAAVAIILAGTLVFGLLALVRRRR